KRDGGAEPGSKTGTGTGTQLDIKTSGTAPTVVNNVLTPGVGPGGTVGYEADFSFAQAYQFYAFGASTVAFASGNADQELSAVAAMTPEPATWLLPATALVGLLIRKARGASIRRFGC